MRSRPLPLRRAVAATAVVVMGFVTILPQPAAADTGERARTVRELWQRTQEDLSDTSQHLTSVEQNALAASDELIATERRLAATRRKLDRLRQRLAAARLTQARSESAHDRAIQQLGQATMVLVATSDALEGHLEELRIELVTAYKYAGDTAQLGGVVEALDNAGSVTAFLTSYAQLQSGAERKHDLVETVTALAQRLENQREVVAALERRREHAESEAIAERRRTADLTARQHSLVEAVMRERRSQRRLVRLLERERRGYEAEIAGLTEASDSLAAELATYRWVGGAPGTGELSWPIDGTLTSNFGSRVHPIFADRRLHAGIDIGAATGQPVFASAAGTVMAAGVRGGYGNCIVVDHGGGLTTVYAHLSHVGVYVGQTVTAVQEIGEAGSTGNSTGPHLHFEVRSGGAPQDPMRWF